MNIGSAFPSAYLKAGELAGEVTYTIKSVDVQDLGRGRDAERKPVVHFHESGKGLVLNKTNSNAIAELYGYETDGWAGKRITLITATVEFQGKPVQAIRLKPPPATNAAMALAGAKRAAWEAFKRQVPPGDANTDVAAGFRLAAEQYLPAKPPQTWDVLDWQQFLADGFAPRSPVSSEQVFKEDDIPF